MEKKKEKDQKPLSVNEPVAAYENKRMHFFNSFEEANAFDHLQRSLMGPLENFSTVTTLVSQIFQKEMKEHPTLGNKIYFDTK
jgi:hypothetical protein